MTTTPSGSVRQRMPISSRILWTITGTLAAMMIIGSIWDYGISQNLFNPSSGFGRVFAAYGEAPAFLVWVMAGALLIRHRNRERTAIGVFQLIGAVLLIALGTLAASYLPSRYLDLAPAAVGVIGVTLAAGTFLLTWRLCAATPRATAIRLALILFLVPLIEMIVINIVKIFWERPRMRMISETSDAQFMHWWLPGYDGKDALIAAGIEGEEFKSFPSGHTANAAVAMMLAQLGRMSATLRSRTDLLFGIGFVWALLVALSRIIMGAHFLTDVTIGLTITLLVILIADRLAFGSTSKEITA